MTFLKAIAASIISTSIIGIASAERLGNKQCGLTVPSTVTSRSDKILIAHRGASFHLPEHTLAAYRLALELGADYIEPDLVATKDGKLIAYHSVDLNVTSDVATVFPDRQTFSTTGNRTGYWVFNFELEEIRKLTVKQRVPDARSTTFDGLYTIPTLQEILKLVDTWNAEIHPQLTTTKKRAGLYAELKDPKWFETEANLNIADLLLTELESSSHTQSMFNDTECASLKFDEYLVPPLVIQCFDGETLKYLSNEWTSRRYGISPPMIILATEEDCLEDNWWYHVGEWAHFVHGVGPDKACFAQEESAKTFMELSREHELAVHVWTERPELSFVLPAFDNLEQEMEYLVCQVGVDGFFTEDVARSAVFLAKGCEDAMPTSSPSTLADEQCAHDSDESPYLAFASGIMGCLVGIISTMFLMNSRYCKSRRHTRRQLRIPTHEDVEMI